MDPESQYVSTVSLAEFWFGVRIAEARCHSQAQEFRRRLANARKYPVLDITKHTSDEYSKLKSCMAIKYLLKPNVLRRSRPRWIECWVDKATGRKLGIDENDLWQCAQAKERACVFVTADRGIQRIADADPGLRLCII